ncbi:MAG: hypothetical protein ACK5H2_14130 [Beutenbergiaceae bacterium]
MRERMDNGLVDLRTLHATSRASRAQILLFRLTGEFARSHDYFELLDCPSTVARDGEVGERTDRLQVRVAWRALTMYRPDPATHPAI